MVDAVFFDTSVLVAGSVDLGEASVHAMRAMDMVARGAFRTPLTAWHCCLEFYSVVTRLPGEYRLTPSDALRLLESEVLERMRVVELPARARLGFLRSAGQDGVAGGRVYDAHIGEVAWRAGAQLVVTENVRHFQSLLRHGVRVVRSSEIATVG